MADQHQHLLDYLHRFSRLSPPLLLAVAFVLLILLGTALLKLPLSLDTPISWSGALFTATSAVTVTGLVVTETGPTFSFVGEAVILILIQVGGLGIMTFALLALVALGGHIPGPQHPTSTGFRKTTYLPDLLRTAGTVTKIALVFEIMALLPLTLVWIPENGWIQGLWWSVFHAVSAFNNAGFTLLTTASWPTPAIRLSIP